MIPRRDFLLKSAGIAATFIGLDSLAATQSEFPQATLNPSELAHDESYWSKIANFYEKAPSLINLEQGYWGKMSKPVLAKYIELTERVNREMAIYARKDFYRDFPESTQAIADRLGVHANEIAITRNATESFVNLITQYDDLKKGDAVLWADCDYPSYQKMMAWLAKEKGAEAVRLSLPASSTAEEIAAIYQEAIETHPNLKLMLLTHVSNQHGMVLPAKEIAAMARKQGVDLICDCAQSWGLLDFQIGDLGVDWAIFNLHKWMGSPVGVGALYIRAGTLDKIKPFPGEDPADESVAKRVHLATSNFAAFLTVPAALSFHDSVGGKNKELRLKYLRSIWVEEALQHPKLEVLGAKDDASASGMGSFRLRGKTSLEDGKTLHHRLEAEFGIFTIYRDALDSGCCIRVTPQVFTSADEMRNFAHALRTIATT